MTIPLKKTSSLAFWGEWAGLARACLFARCQPIRPFFVP
nr:MAG TPA: hypothetical protein [Caudoviricetes sp.]